MTVQLPSPGDPQLGTLSDMLGVGAFEIGGSGTAFGQDLGDDLIGSIIRGPGVSIPTSLSDIPSALANLADFLLTLPLEALQMMKDFIPGAEDSEFLDSATAVATIMAQLAGAPIMASIEALAKLIEVLEKILKSLGLDGDLPDFIDSIPGLDDFVSAFQDFMGLFGNISDLGSGLPELPGLDDIALLGPMIDKLFEAVTNLENSGTLIDDLVAALQSIPFGNIVGIGGPIDIGASIQDTWDQLIGGLVGSVGSGAGLADIFNVGQLVSSWAARGRDSWDILGIRNNKSLISGFLPTSESNFALPISGGSAPTFALTQSTATTGYKRVTQSSPLGVVSWLGSGLTSITHFFVNIFQMDPDTGDKTLVHASDNIVGSVSSSLAFNVYELATPIQTEPGEIYGIELAVRGGGTHSVVGQQTWVPNHPTVFPRNLAAVRNSGTSAAPSTISSGSISYSSNIPWIETGVDSGTGSVTHPNQTTLFTSSGSIPIPDWAEHVDVIAVGGGGGGHKGGTWGIWGEGGDGGNWSTDTWDRGTDFSGSGVSITVSVGAAGSAGTSGSGGNGGSSTAAITGHTVTATGGDGGSGYTGHYEGYSPGNQAYLGTTYVAGGQQSTYGAKGATPGGAGAGGNWISFQNGGAGASGAVWIVFRAS